jgi:hypothetical protein
MASNYAQLEKMMSERYKCTTADIAEKIYKGRSDITDVIRANADMGQCKELFEKHKNLCEVRDGDAFKGSIGKGGAIGLLKKVVANWVAQDLFIRNLNTHKINCELGKFHRDRAFEGCLSVEPTAILWAGERIKSRHRLMDIQIVYGTSMEDGFVTLKKERFLKLIEKKAILLTMNMTTLKYSLVDFYTTDTVCEEFVLAGGMHVIKIALKDSKCALNRLGIVRDHISNVIANTIGDGAEKVTETQANFIAVFAVAKDGKSRKVVKTYSIPEDAAEKRHKAEYANNEEVQKRIEVEKAKSEAEAKEVIRKAEERKRTDAAKAAVVEKATPTHATTSAVQQKPKTDVKNVSEAPKPTPKQIQKPVQKPTPQTQPTVAEEDAWGYDFSALDSFA